jgi:carboxypeptidase T
VQVGFLRKSDYLGQSVKFRFVLKSDGAVTKDGYYFDDFTISHNGSTGLIENTKIFTAFPNPTSGELILSFDKVLSNGQMELLDLNGKVIVNKTISFATTKMTLSTVGLNNGVYYLVYKDENNRFSQPQKIVVLNQ